MRGVWQDIRFAVRILSAHRQFSVVAVFVLALGIGATTAVFSVLNAVLLRPLPYADPERLVAISGLFKSASGTRPSRVVPLSDVAEWRGRAGSFESMGAFAYTQLPVRVGQQAFSPITALMDPDFLPTLGKPLAMGTFFDPAAKEDGDRSAIVSHAFWREALGADGDAIGRSVAIDGEPYVIRGVLAAEFQFPRSDASYSTKPVDLLIPSSSFPGFPARSRQWFAIARLKAGVPLAAAEAELRSIAEGLATRTAAGNVWSVQVAPLDEETTRRSREALLVVMGISIVLLMIASTNLMNLFFSRGTARLGEMSIRRAIGGTTSRIVRQLVVEALVLAAVGGAIGVLLAGFAVRALVALSPVHLPVTGAINIDGGVLAFTAAACTASALIASLFPALQVSVRSDEALRRPGMRASAGPGASRVQKSLCVAQIALGMALLASAGLLARSFWQLNAVDPGFDYRQVFGFNLSVPNDVPLAQRAQFYADALDQVRTIPGVERAGLISFLPPETRAGVLMGLAVEGSPPLPPTALPRIANTLITSVDYFATVKTPVVQGREFTDHDVANAAPVIIVNEALVRRHLPAGDPIGRRIGTGFDALKPVRTIVGVVKDSHDRGLAAEPMPTAYIPFKQFSLPYGSIALRTALPPESIVPVIRDRINRLNPAVPLTEFQTISYRLQQSLREPRFFMLMAAGCAALAVLFVTFGLYGLVSYAVSRRTPELGIRMALGAQRTTILALVLRQGLFMAVAGVALGLALAAVFTRALTSLLFQVTPLDPLTLAAAAALVVLVTLAACLVPARRASRISPVSALRYE